MPSRLAATLSRPVRLDRRTFLQAIGWSATAAFAGSASSFAAQLQMFAAAYQVPGGGYGVAILSEDGRVLREVALPDRGHDITVDRATRRAVVFARQPGTFAVIFDLDGHEAPVTLASVEGRHFYGHGVFSPDGKLLYATENDYDAAAGMVGIYDATDGFSRIGEFPTHGVGPHELLLCPDGRTLAIANGGIETHPDFGAAKLNLATMQPSLVFIDRLTGELLEKHELPPDLHRLSIRHMDFDGAGTLWFGCQYEGPATERPALVGRARKGEHFGLVDLPEPVVSGLRNYIGSVAANPDAGTVAVSSPQGNRLLVIDAASAAVVADRPMTEVCGIAPDKAGFIASTGIGEIERPDGTVTRDRRHAWDNHVLRI
jgi:Uncharacterized protein conserved in bacteria